MKLYCQMLVLFTLMTHEICYKKKENLVLFNPKQENSPMLYNKEHIYVS